MPRVVSLTAYVKRRNGVALGAPGSMGNMLMRSLGAGSFDVFWHHWNPIWGYYLSRRVMKPLSARLPVGLAQLLTFAVSGALHDVAITLVKWDFTFVLTPWFSLMGIIVVMTKLTGISYHKQIWLLRAWINLSIIAGSLAITHQLV